MKAMIFAAGFGKRLHPLTLSTPKALVEINSRPMLDRIIEQLICHGVDDIMINTHYLHSKIESYLHSTSHPVRISLSYEKTILGTGGGLYKTRHFWVEGDFIVYNVDIICRADLTALVKTHQEHKAIVTLAINKAVSNSMLLIDEEGSLVGRSQKGAWKLYRKPKGKAHEVGFCGFQVISPRYFEVSPPLKSFSIIDDYMNLTESGENVMTWSIGDAYWEDIGTVEALNRASQIIHD